MSDTASPKTHISVVISGNVDSGKSTTTGRLIFDLGGINEREMQKLQAEADRLGKSSFAFAFYMDTTAQERERGITIQCTTKEFHTSNFHYTIIDAPGHRDFIKNMITGASQADVGVLLCPADGNFEAAIQKGDHRAGELVGQTRNHARLLNLLGVKQLIVGINKMDEKAAQYSQSRYEEVRNEMKNVLKQTGWRPDFIEANVVFLPYSAFAGDNVVNKSTNMSWWNGQDVKTINGDVVHIETLVDALDKYVVVPPRKMDGDVRVPISGVHNIKGIGDVLTGRVEQGEAKPGMEVVFLPTHTDANPCTGKVFNIEMHHKKVDSAMAGDNVGMNIKGLRKENMPRSGDIMVLKKDTTIRAARLITIQVQVLDHPGEIKVGYSPIGYIRTAHTALRIKQLNWKVGKETGGKKLENPVCLKANEGAEIVVEPAQPFVAEEFNKCEGLGRVAIMEGNSVVMLGKVVKVEY